MAEYVTAAVQAVGVGSYVLLNDTSVAGSGCIVHRQGAGQVTLRGIASQSRARFLVEFGGNVAIPSGATVAPISLAMSLNGEPLASSTMISTPAATGDFNNVFGSIFVDVPKGCCITVGVENTSSGAIEVKNVNFIVTREA